MAIQAGWYEDGSGRRRWWDGQAWTDHVCMDASVQLPGGELGSSPAGGVQVVSPGRAESVFGRVGESIKRAADKRAAIKEERQRQWAECQAAAGALVVRGVFGVSEVEIYQGGYVRIGSRESFSRRSHEGQPRYEKLVSVSYVSPEAERVSPVVGDGAALKVATALVKGGRSVLRTSAPALAVTGIAHVVKAKSGKSILTIATDCEIHTLTNESENGVGITVVKREQEGVGRTLADAAQAVISASQSPLSLQVAELESGPATKISSSSFSDRLRELAALRAEGVLDDAEFAAAKAKILEEI